MASPSQSTNLHFRWADACNASKNHFIVCDNHLCDHAHTYDCLSEDTTLYVQSEASAEHVPLCRFSQPPARPPPHHFTGFWTMQEHPWRLEDLAPAKEMRAMKQAVSRHFPTSCVMMQAHLAPATTAEDVERCMNTLLQHNKIRNATHNILAYRIYVENRDAWLQVRVSELRILVITASPHVSKSVDKTLCWAACSPHASNVGDLIRWCLSTGTGL